MLEISTERDWPSSVLDSRLGKADFAACLLACAKDSSNNPEIYTSSDLNAIVPETELPFGAGFGLSFSHSCRSNKRKENPQ